MNLVPFTAAHITPEYLGWLNDRDLMRYSRQRLLDHTRESACAYLASKHGPMWAVMADGGMVGTLGADVEGTTADLGIMIGRPGKGYGRAAWGRGIQALLLESPGRRITAGTHIDNAAMIAIFAAYHMRLLAIRDGHVYVAL